LAGSEVLVVPAQRLALSGSITVRNSREVDIGINISSDELKNIITAAVSIIAVCAFATYASRITLHEKYNYLKAVKEDIRKGKEGIEEGSSCNTTPILLHHSTERMTTV
jgi:ATP/ADP translocase